MKQCRVCKNTKTLDFFPQNLSYRDGRATICKTCSAKESARRRKEEPHIYKALKFKTDPDLIKSLLTVKECEICGGTTHRTHLAIDHNHSTGKIRGMLCDPCNQGLGKFKDDIQIMKKAIQYLEERDATT